MIFDVPTIETMERKDHPLKSPSLGSQKTLTSFHFGSAGQGPKVYVQASLHAEELPGMLVAHHLRALLEAADAAGCIAGEVVLVPVANPLGLAQRVDHKAMGRFDLASSENFNRHYPDFAKAVWPSVEHLLGPDSAANAVKVRQAMHTYLDQWEPVTELDSLRRTLLTLSYDADFVLDLHCDGESVMHLYTETACWPQLESLAQFLHCETVLLAHNSGSNPFDECLSGVWWRLAESITASGKALPLPQACCSATIELRGEADVSHALALSDAKALIAYLQHIKVLSTHHMPELPSGPCHATPLAGSLTLRAPAAGVVVFAVPAGSHLEVGDLVAEIVDPIANQIYPVVASVAGRLYARIRERYAMAGAELGKIAGAKAFRTGELLGA